MGSVVATSALDGQENSLSTCPISHRLFCSRPAAISSTCFSVKRMFPLGRARAPCVFLECGNARVCYSSADAGPDSSENSVNGGEEKKRHDESIFECDATKGPLVSCERSQSFSKGARYCYRSWFQRRQIQTDSICYAVGGCPRDALAAALTDGRKDAEGKASRCK